MNVKFLMKFLSIVLVWNTFFCMENSTVLDPEYTCTEADRLLAERRLKPIGYTVEREFSLTKLLKFGVPANPVEDSEKIQREEEVKNELMQCPPSTISNNVKAGLFAKIARNEYELAKKKLTLPVVYNTIDAAKYYAKDPTKRSHVEQLFNFIQEHSCYRNFTDFFKKFVKNRREEILKK